MPGQYTATKATSQTGVKLRRAMRVTITCEECGERHRLERKVTEPGPIWIICHSCELPLQAVLDAPTASRQTAPAPASTQTGSSLWAGVFDMSDRSAAA